MNDHGGGVRWPEQATTTFSVAALTPWEAQPPEEREPFGHRLFTLLWECAAMQYRGQVLGPASTRFNDYTGTVAADDLEAIKDRPSLYELALIDRDRFTIVGMDLNVDGPVNATVYAVDRTEHKVGAPADIAGLGKTRGEIPVLAFDVPEPNVEEFMRHAFRRISIRLLRQDLGDQVLAVSEPRSAEDL